MTARTQSGLGAGRTGRLLGAFALVFALSCTGEAQTNERSHATRGTADIAEATFAGGCFWCMEEVLEKLDGVRTVVSGYAGGETPNPSYEQVSSGASGHAEVVQVRYDPTVINYRQLLYVFWRNVDPVTANRQFCDAGSQYRSAIFYHDAEQRRLARASKQALEESGRFEQPIVTEIAALDAFYPAEEYHQDYYKKNPLQYKFYKFSCGREARLNEVWGDDRV